jgi:hypothetical protein
MKKSILFLLLFIVVAVGGAKAQQKEHKYIPLLDTNKIWVESMLYEFGFINVLDKYISTSSDILIKNDTVYTILFQDGSIFTTLREDTLEQKVYQRDYYYTSWGNEILLYDFSLQVGDTFYYPYNNYGFIKVDSIKYKYFFGRIRKVLYFHNPDFTPPTWVEGIGSLSGILEAWTSYGLIGMGGVELNCMYQNNELLYQSNLASVYGCHFEDLDQNPPVLNSCYFSPDTVENKENINLYLNISDQSEIQYVLCGVRAPSNTFYYMLGELERLEGDLYVLKIDTIINPDSGVGANWNEVGQWNLFNMTITDAVNYESYYTFNNKHFYVSHIISNEEIVQNEVRIYPNPICNESKLFFTNNKSDKYIIEVYNIYGDKIYVEETKSNFFEINSGNLNSGVYIYMLYNSLTKQKSIGKFIKI